MPDKSKDIKNEGLGYEIPANRLKTAPRFSKILQTVFENSPMQEKRIGAFLSEQDDFYWELAEEFAGNLSSYLNSENIAMEYAVDSYLDLCCETVAEQFKFLKTGRYSCDSTDVAISDVYGNIDVMKAYMHGVLMTQFLWKNHYLMLKYYIKETLPSIRAQECLEIGVGHGLLLSHAMRQLPDSNFRVVDISETSIGMAKKTLKHFGTSSRPVDFILSDIREYKSDRPFDFIIMGEVLEHVEDPKSLLMAVKSILAENGRFYITTCANCPAIDHVYLYDSVEAIIEMIEDCGFRIVNDVHLPVDDVPKDDWKLKRVGINYAGLLAHA